MLYALNCVSDRVPATPGGRAFCPVCGGGVIARCGPKVARHWAHKHHSSCDPWSEESAWHIAWKSIIRENRCEIVLRQGDVIHRADIVGNRNTVIELQHSFISPEEIRARERFYGNMVWVFDAAGFFGNMVLVPADDCVAIFWYYPRAALYWARKPVYFHLPCGNILKIEYAHPKKPGEPLRGWGRLMGWKPFFHLYLSSVVKSRYKDGEQPESIRNRTDMDISRLKFHHNIKTERRCRCDSSDGYVNCAELRKSEVRYQIRRLLCQDGHY